MREYEGDPTIVEEMKKHDKIIDELKNDNDRLKAVLTKIIKQSPDHFASALAQAALDGWDARK